MIHYVKLEKSVDAPKDEKGNKKRGDVRGGGYIKRVVTGTDKDGSPQYRYIRSQEALDAWEENQRKNKPEKKKKADKSDLSEKVGKEHKDSTDKIRSKEKNKKTEKSLFVKAG